MSSLSSTESRPASRAEYANRYNPNSNTPPLSSNGRDTGPEFGFSPRQGYKVAWRATRCTSHRPSESSETTILYDGGVFDDVSSVTLQDEFPWHEVGVNKWTQGIPSTVVPALLHGGSDLSPSRSSLGEAKGGSRDLNEDSSDSKHVVPRYSAVQKEKWKARKVDNAIHGGRYVGSPSPRFRFDGIYNPVEDWVIHNRPILQDYADRQTSLPLGRRLEVSVDEPSRFILGAVQLLVNRDRGGRAERSRQLGPQLIENFVDVDCWVKEYFRSRHGTQDIGCHVSALLTIVVNNFYEGQVQLIDRLVEFALENMRFCGRSSLGIEDFAFGFDFKMSQDLPFYVETSSQIRKPLPMHVVKVQSGSEQVITNSGRQVKPTKRAQAAAEQAQRSASSGRQQNKGNNTSPVNDKRTANGSVPAMHHQNEAPAQTSSDRVAVLQASMSSRAEPHVEAPAPLKMAFEHTKHRPAYPSNLGLPPDLPDSSSTPANTHQRSDDDSRSKPSASSSTNTPNIISSSPPNHTAHPLPPLKIKLPALNLATSILNNSTCQAIIPADALGRGASRSGDTRLRGPRNRRDRGRERRVRDASLTLRAETLKATLDSTRALSMAAGKAEVTATVIPGTRLHDADNYVSTGDHRPYARQSCLRIRMPLLPSNDPGHPQGKKRKLDDCED